MTDTEIAGNLPDGNIVRAERKKPCEPRDGTWASWKIAAEQRWIRENGGLLTVDGGFNPRTFPALLKTKLIAGAIGRGRRTSAKAADGYAATYLVIEASMNGKTKHSEIGLELAASRARISVRAASHAAKRAHLLGLWIKSERHGDDGEWTSNRYDFSEAKNAHVLGKKAVSVLQAVKLIIKPNKISARPSARVGVLVWILDQIVLTQASASFTLAELVRGTGLQRRAAEKALNTLLADRTFVKIGEGTLTLPEGVSSEHGRCRVDGPLWTSKVTHPAFAKRKGKIVSETADVRTPDSADGAVLETSYGRPETAYRALKTADGALLETADGMLESTYGMPETAYIRLEDSLAEKSPEGANNLSQSTRSRHHAEKSEPLSPPSVSGVPPSPQEAAKGEARDALPTDTQIIDIRVERLLALDAVLICEGLLGGRVAPPNLSDEDGGKSFFEAMSFGILADNRPSNETMMSIRLAARRHDPVLIFGILAKALLLELESGDRETTWLDIASVLTCVLVNANDEDLVVVPNPAIAAVDELSKTCVDVEMTCATPLSNEAHNERQI